MKWGTTVVAVLAMGGLAGSAMAGIYSSHSSTTGVDGGVPVSSITTWAGTISNYAPSPGVGPSFRNPAAVSGTLSLGELYRTSALPATGTEPNAGHSGSEVRPFGGDINDPTDTYGFIGIDAPGSVTFFYPTGIFDGPGADLAVKENGFALGSGLFCELAYVEVSSNGTDFLRFPSISLNVAPVATSGAFKGFDMTNVHNLAGKHASNLATPFDLAELSSHTMVLSGAVDLAAITYIRLVDVVGDGTAALDSQNNPILDNWVTYDSAGFDVSIVGGSAQAVGVFHSVPEPASMLLALAGAGVALARRRRG